jgi:hypothetical protein
MDVLVQACSVIFVEWNLVLIFKGLLSRVPILIRLEATFWSSSSTCILLCAFFLLEFSTLIDFIFLLDFLSGLGSLFAFYRDLNYSLLVVIKYSHEIIVVSLLMYHIISNLLSHGGLMPLLFSF